MATLEQELQTQTIKDPYKRAFLNVLFTANSLKTRQRALLEPFGISGTQYNVLRILRGQPSHCLATYSIKDRMVERNCDATRVVDRLVKAGYAERHGCPNDKRSTLVKITEQGLKLLAAVEPHIEGYHRMGSLTPEEAAHLSELLDRVRDEPLG